MKFIDKVTVDVRAGDGGDGLLSFRHEKFVDKGGPDGGDGGDGGDIVLVATRNQNTLAAFRHQKELRAKSGQSGGKRRKHGKSAPDLPIEVPVGTVVATEKEKIIADLTNDGEKAVVARGGHGGFGNAHFVSSRRQTPRFAEKGEKGESFRLNLELKMIADIGLVGLPNAGKSTLLGRISNARPEVADYPFTTLTPNLGVVDIDQTSSLLFADIPGLIEGASQGKGLGHDFLRHIERTAVIVHLVDAYKEDLAAAYKTVKKELQAYQKNLGKRPEIVALNKVEGLDEATVSELIRQVKKAVPKNTPVFAISAHSGQGIKELLYATKNALDKEKSKQKPRRLRPLVPVFTIKGGGKEWAIHKNGETFEVNGTEIERFAERTDYDNEQAIQRLRDIMRKMGIMHELSRMGIEPGQKIIIGQKHIVIY